MKLWLINLVKTIYLHLLFPLFTYDTEKNLTSWEDSPKGQIFSNEFNSLHALPTSGITCLNYVLVYDTMETFNFHNQVSKSCWNFETHENTHREYS